MKTLDLPERTADPVISEVRAIKRQVVAEHGGDLDSFFASIRQRQSRNPRLVKTIGGEQGVGGQPPIVPSSAPLPLSNGGGATT
jgi:hypothetical protein